MQHSRKRKSQPQLIHDLVWKLLRKRGVEKAVLEQQVVQQWGKIVGPAVAQQTRAVDAKDGKLFVEVGSAAWRNELVFLKPEILEKIHDFIGKKVVQDIIFLSQKETR